VRFGISPFGIYRNEASSREGSRTSGLQTYDDLHADVLHWVRKGWVDYIVPQIYWNIGHQAADYAELTHWWGKHTPQKKAQLYIGQHAARTMDGGQLEEKLALSRQNSSGNSWWSGEDLVKNYKGLGDSLITSYQTYRALLPEVHGALGKTKAPAAISLIRLRPYDAETLLENLANLFRAQLRDGSQSSTLGQEIEWAQEYIAIEQIRMGHMRVQVMWQHQAPDDAETPHLLLQPLLENAVFHGVESTHRPGMITVFTKLNKSSIYIRIENPYTPPESSENAKPHKGNSMALHNLKERLTLMYDNDAKIQSRQLDGIFRVDIRLPYRKKASDVNRLFG